VSCHNFNTHLSTTIDWQHVVHQSFVEAQLASTDAAAAPGWPVVSIAEEGCCFLAVLLLIDLFSEYQTATVLPASLTRISSCDALAGCGGFGS
jgi:hypothetical protein